MATIPVRVRDLARFRGQKVERERAKGTIVQAVHAEEALGVPEPAVGITSSLTELKTQG